MNFLRGRCKSLEVEFYKKSKVLNLAVAYCDTKTGRHTTQKRITMDIKLMEALPDEELQAIAAVFQATSDALRSAIDSRAAINTEILNERGANNA